VDIDNRCCSIIIENVQGTYQRQVLEFVEVEKATAFIDEINQYQLGCYINSYKAVWSILSFPIHKRHPAVVHLAVHHEKGQHVYFTTENAGVRELSPSQTSLTAFFTLCMNDIVFDDDRI